MKTKFQFMLLCLAMLSACTQENDDSLFDYKENVRSNTLQYHVSESDAIKQAGEFLYQIDMIKTRSDAENVIQSVEILTKPKMNYLLNTPVAYYNLPDTLFYAVNFKDSMGYALVSVDNRIGGIVSYIEHGAFDAKEHIENEGFKSFLTGLMEYYENTLSFWPDLPGDSTGGNNPSDLLLEKHYTVDSIFRPLLRTKWGQSYPYNILCPETPYGARTLTGCVATAVGQILAYHRSPSSFRQHEYDWDAILEDEIPFVFDTQLMVSQLLNDIGSLVEAKYSDTLTTASASLVALCLDSMQYRHTNYLFFHLDSCIADIARNHPVFMRGTNVYSVNDYHSQHAWVVDGYIFRSLHLLEVLPNGGTREIISMPQKLLHCNWGADGKNNGYFLSTAFDPYDGLKYHSTRSDVMYNNDNAMYLYIQPKR